jgi:hypothetical protein
VRPGAEARVKLAEGMQVITGVTEQESADAGSSSPFESSQSRPRWRPGGF